MTALMIAASAIFLHQTGILRVFGWVQMIAGTFYVICYLRSVYVHFMCAYCTSSIVILCSNISEGLNYVAPDAAIYDEFGDYDPEQEDEQAPPQDEPADDAPGGVGLPGVADRRRRREADRYLLYVFVCVCVCMRIYK